MMLISRGFASKGNIQKLICQRSRFLSRRNDFIYPTQTITKTCACGKVGIEFEGASVYNYFDHSQNTRDVTKESYISVSAFKPAQMKFKLAADQTIQKTMEKDLTQHFVCGCDKKDHLAVDMTKSLGLVGLNTSNGNYSHNVKPVSAEYQPNHHFFYSQRVHDMDDTIPKWKGLVDGEIHDNSSDSRPDLKNATPNAPPLSKREGWVISSNRPGEWNSLSGRYRKDVLPLTPTTSAEPLVYHHTESDPASNYNLEVNEEKLNERIRRKYYNIHPHPPANNLVYANGNDSSANATPNGSHASKKHARTLGKKKRDVIIIGGGHNGLTTAAYLAKKGLDVLVLERRHIVGGAAVTEEIVPGFKFSRASYLAGLLRPHIIKDLELEKYGFKYLPRNPSSFTPTKPDSIYGGKYLMLGEDMEANRQSIAQFSLRDAENYPKYEDFLSQIREIMQPLLDSHPLNPLDPHATSWKERLATLSKVKDVVRLASKHSEVVLPFYELFTGPASQILDRWFESDILKTTLATDAVIGAAISPKHNGSAYVLLHHVMGEAAGKKGVWAYVEGGMGAISNAIAQSAQSQGAEILTNAIVRSIVHDGQKVSGVVMDDGTTLEADTIISGTTPYHTMVELIRDWTQSSSKLGRSNLPGSNSELDKFIHHLRHTDYSCGAFKINCAVSKLPNFTCVPSPADGKPGPMHRGTVHFESHMEEIELAYREASMGIPASRPVIEMTIPSSLDRTVAPEGKHVVQFFIQYAPYDINPKIGSWADPAFKESFVHRCFSIVDEFCPGFSSSVIGYDALSPLDLERIFGLHKGNIAHGSLGLHQLMYARPMVGYSNHRTPLKGLYMCSAGTHPGGGVMGASGHNCANVVLYDLNR